MVHQCPTWGAYARAQLQQRGIPYWGDVKDEVRRRLECLSESARKAFAVACAERVMRTHEHLPPAEQAPFTLRWRPILDAIWSGLATGEEDTKRQVVEAFEWFYASPYDHDEGPDGPQDADENAAAASIYAAECFRDGDVEPALGAANRMMDIVFDKLVERHEEGGRTADQFVEDLADPILLEEMNYQLAVLDLLEQKGITASVLNRLRERSSAL